MQTIPKCRFRLFVLLSFFCFGLSAYAVDRTVFTVLSHGRQPNELTSSVPISQPNVF